MIAGSTNVSIPYRLDGSRNDFLQGPLLDLKPRLTSYVKPGCPLLLSGLMTTQVPAIQEAYQEEFQDFKVYSEGVWALVFALKKAGPSCSLAYDFAKLPDEL